MPPLKLFNTLTRTLELFVPPPPARVGIYTCGPTVYHSAHIGNLRSYVFPDVLKKTLRLLGYTVTHVINITDVGHLTSDADSGDDKVERAARQQHRTAREIADAYEEEFVRDLGRLHIALPDHRPRATDFVAGASGQIELIKKLEARGYTYRTDDGLYFDTAKFPDYGRLARLKAEGLQEGSRVEMGAKRHKTDFALWKLSPPGAQRQMEWDSPWGRGFPGWHIECSAMSMHFLGETFDIHTGGSDHIPVHHTNEIAQSEAATGHPFVRVWLHGEHLRLVEEKRSPQAEEEFRRMGKSEGNFIRLQDLVDGKVGGLKDPMAFRYLVLNSHYRSFLNFSEEALRAADTALMGLRRALQEAGGVQAPPSHAEPAGPLPPGTVAQQVLEDLCDDLNTPKALGTLWTAVRDAALPAQDKLAAAAFAERVLSLGLFDFTRIRKVLALQMRGALSVPAVRDKMISEGIPEHVRQLVEQRVAARLAKQFTESDRLRDELVREGWEIVDLKDGFQLTSMKR